MNASIKLKGIISLSYWTVVFSIEHAIMGRKISLNSHAISLKKGDTDFISPSKFVLDAVI